MKYVVLAVAGLIAAGGVGYLLLAKSAPAETPTPKPTVIVHEQPQTAPGSRLERLDALTVAGKLRRPNSVSAVALRGDLLLLVSDETNHVELLRKTANEYEPDEPIVLSDVKSEMDLEAIALDGDTVYVVGSHGKVRPKIKAKETYEQTREKLTVIEHRSACDQLIRFKLDANGKAVGIEKASLRTAIESNPTLKSFASIPAKENGVDIEGLAVKDGKLFVGLRGPVLRANYVPVMVTEFGGKTGELRFINLGGRGIRDLAAVRGGFLILAGPMSDGPLSFQLYLWNGNDCLKGADPAGSCELLCDFPELEDGGQEGIFVLEETDAAYELLVVCDGLRNGDPTRYRLRKK